MNSIVGRPLTSLLSVITDNRGRSCPTVDDGFPLIATNCIKPDLLYPVFENIRYVDEETYDGWFRGHPQPGDIVFVCKGSPGRVAMVPDPVSFCIAQDMVALRADLSIVNPRYLYYLLSAPETQRMITNMHVGTMIPHFKKGDFGKLVLGVHTSLSEQKAIAEVLGALDEKIAANRKLAETAARLASTIYLREVAEVSDRRALSEVSCLVSRGVAPKYTDEVAGLVVLNQKCIRDQSVNLGPARRTVPEKVQAIKYLQRNDVLVNSTGVGTLGRVARWTGECEATVDSHVTIVRFDRSAIDPICAGFALLQSQHVIEEMGEGSTGQTELSRSKLADLKFDFIARDRESMIAPKLDALSETASQHRDECGYLAVVRDALLPRLMSGELRVRDAEKAAEAVL